MDLKEYEKIWTDKVIQADRNFASMHLMDNVVSKDDPLIGQFVSKLMSGGTRVRQYPMIGTDQSTYKPAIHATNELVGISGGISGGKKKKGITTKDVMDFGKGFQQGFVAPFQMVGDAATAIAPAVALASASGGAKGAIELEKAKESLKKFVNNERKTKPSKKHLQILEANGIISKKSDETEGGKVNRLKKAAKWTNFAVDTAKSGLGLAEQGKAIAEGGKVNRLKKAKKWTSFAVDTAKSGLGLAEQGKAIAGAGKKSTSPWIQHVKDYSKANNITYKEAMSKAKATYKK